MTKTINRIILSLFSCTIASSVVSTDTVPAHTFDVNIPQDPEKPIRRKRMRKSSKKEKNETNKILTYMDMEYEQLLHAKDIQKANGYTTATINFHDQLLKISTDITLLSQHLL